jgi:hypothetical protein
MEYKFDGNWSFQIELDSFNQLEYENTSKSIEIIIRDFLDEEFEPSSEQVNTINFLIDNHETIVECLLEKVWSNWKEICNDYSLKDNTEFPKIESKNDLKKVICIKTIYIQPLHKNGFSYYGLEGNCMWDEEHGLGFINHKDRIIEFGGAEEADASGREINDHPDNVRSRDPEKPKLYKCHPVFETFKPSHKEANQNYPHKLIESGLNEEFIDYLKIYPEIDYVDPDDWQKRTYLTSACLFSNEVIFNQLVDKAQNLNNAIYSAHKRKNIKFISKLIEKGANVNETHFGTSILTEAVEQHLRTISVNLTEEQMDANYQRMVDYYNQPFVNKSSIIVKEMLTHPKETIEKSRSYLEVIMKYGVQLDNQRIEYVKHGVRNDPKALEAIDNELKWLKNKL